VKLDEGCTPNLREADLTRLWWNQGAITATLTVVGIVDKIKTNGLPQWLGILLLFF
jgi:hypothetical protein